MRKYSHPSPLLLSYVGGAEGKPKFLELDAKGKKNTQVVFPGINHCVHRALVATDFHSKENLVPNIFDTRRVTGKNGALLATNGTITTQHSPGKNVEERSGIFSHMFFLFVQPLVKFG